MCINEETSMTAFLIGCGLSIYILYRGIKKKNKYDFVVGCLFISIASMQLLEYFIWKNQKCNSKNSFFTILLVVLLLIQIITYYLATNSVFKINDIIIHISIILSIIVFGYLIVILVKNKDKLCSKPSLKSCRLQWDSLKYLYNNNRVITLIGGFLYFFMMYKLKKNVDGGIRPFLSKHMNTLVLILSVILAIILEKKHFFNIFGSFWCFICAFYPIVYLLKL